MRGRRAAGATDGQREVVWVGGGLGWCGIPELEGCVLALPDCAEIPQPLSKLILGQVSHRRLQVIVYRTRDDKVLLEEAPDMEEAHLLLVRPLLVELHERSVHGLLQQDFRLHAPA